LVFATAGAADVTTALAEVTVVLAGAGFVDVVVGLTGMLVVVGREIETVDEDCLRTEATNPCATGTEEDEETEALVVERIKVV